MGRHLPFAYNEAKPLLDLPIGDHVLQLVTWKELLCEGDLLCEYVFRDVHGGTWEHFTQNVPLQYTLGTYIAHVTQYGCTVMSSHIHPTPCGPAHRCTRTPT